MDYREPEGKREFVGRPDHGRESGASLDRENDPVTDLALPSR
jgi:hypothetical protein